MNIVFSSDENYAMQTCVSIVSMFENNKDVQAIRVFILANGITDDSQDKIREVARNYNREVIFIDFTPYIQDLLSKTQTDEISTFARLYIPSVLPEDCHRVIYIDCDTLVCGSLKEMWETDLESKTTAGVLDTMAPYYKKAIDLEEDADYVNAGVLLIDLIQWRKEKIQETFFDYIRSKNGKVMFLDQGVINAVLHDELMILHPKYNVMTTFYVLDYKRMMYLYHMHTYYSECDLKEACEQPVIIHLTEGMLGDRAWQKGSKHPKHNLYKKYLSMTPWCGCLQDKRQLPIKTKMILWAQIHFPITLLKLLNMMKPPKN